MFVIQNHRDHKPFKIVLQRVREENNEGILAKKEIPDVYKRQCRRLKPCKISLRKIKEEITEEVPAVKDENIEDVSKEEKWHVRNDMQKPYKITFPKIKEEIKKEIQEEIENDLMEDCKYMEDAVSTENPVDSNFAGVKKTRGALKDELKWDCRHPRVVASSSNSVPSTDGDVPVLYTKMEIVEEDVMDENKIPVIEQNLNFNEDYEENEACTSDSLETEAVNFAEWQETSLQAADSSRYTSELLKETQLENEEVKKYLFYCSSCPFWSSTERLMKMHILKHTTGSSASESSLSTAVLQPSYSTESVCDQADKTMYSCAVGVAKFTEKESLELHVSSHATEKPSSCSDCAARSYQGECKITIDACSCSVCPARFPQKSSLDAHVLVHNEKPCSPSESASELLSEHKVIGANGGVGNKPVCSLCQGKLSHKRKVGRPRKNAPLVCPGELFRKQEVVRPRKNTVDSYSCSLCSAKFSRKHYLISHMCKHSGEKLKVFSCSICPAKFSLRSHLAGHILSHSGEKPFACPTCPAKFTLESYLNTHIRSHSGEKPFSCPKCPAKFAMKWNLTKHMVIHNVCSRKNLKARILGRMT